LSDKRAYHLTRFYELLAQLERNLGGSRRLSECSGRMDWPRLGVYFFRETSESRYETGVGQRIVRVGTHALKLGARSTLWGRLSQHRGKADGSGGNHRGSVFRKIIGAAMTNGEGYGYPTWGHGNSAPKAIREGERPLEEEVSAIIGAMPFLWLEVDDEPGPDSLRGYIERNAIALLSNYEREPIDPPSPEWLGHYSNLERVKLSGLWNSNHVEDTYTPTFLDTMEQLIDSMDATGRGR
jgi:hypothetical protein